MFKQIAEISGQCEKKLFRPWIKNDRHTVQIKTVPASSSTFSIFLFVWVSKITFACHGEVETL
jgi:hypothetical protein